MTHFEARPAGGDTEAQPSSGQALARLLRQLVQVVTLCHPADRPKLAAVTEDAVRSLSTLIYTAWQRPAELGIEVRASVPSVSQQSVAVIVADADLCTFFCLEAG